MLLVDVEQTGNARFHIQDVGSNPTIAKRQYSLIGKAEYSRSLRAFMDEAEDFFKNLSQ